MKSILIAIAILFSLSRTYSMDANLVRNGKSDYKIFVSKEATAPERNAAFQLQKYLGEISGCKLPITNQPDAKAKLVYIGFKEAPKALVAGLDIAGFGKEEFVIRSDGKSLLIAGGNSRGTLYGVTTYLRDYLGCRWYTRDVVKLPTQTTIALKKIEDRQKPALEFRQPSYREAYDTTWALHNRVNGGNKPAHLGGSYIAYPWVHTFDKLVPAEKYFATHPEYFAEVNGKRQISQLCLTNPEVTKISIATVFEWIKTHPNANVFSVDQNDYGGYCTCKNCKELDEREGSQSGTLLNFVNQIADTVAKVYPDIQLQTLAYDYTEVPPKTLRPADNVMIRFCHYDYCSAHPLGKCDDHKRYIERLAEWKKIAKKITIWDYYTQFAKYLMPFPNLETVKNDVKFYVDHGAVGLYAQGNNMPDEGRGEFTELRAWVFAQLMWNPEQDGQKLVDEFVENVYGNAAPYITAYIKLLHDQVKSPDAYFSIWEEPEDVNYLGLETVRKADSLFALGKKISQKDKALFERVERAYLPIVYVKLYFHSMGGTAYIEEGKLEETLAYFKKLIADNKITRIAERPDWGSIPAFIEKVNSADHYFTDWHIIGPFDNTERKGLAAEYAPEKQFDPSQTYTGKNGAAVKWRAYDDKSGGYINFLKLFDEKKDVVSYAYRTMKLPEAKIVKFGIGSNDGVKVWVNGKLVLDRPVSRKAIPNDDQISVPMKKGENTILVKVDQLANKWGFYFTQLK